jgi:hypothetical protein
MVHALQAVRQTLRPGGVLVSLTPERYEARITVVRGSTERLAGRLINPSFHRYQLAAERALVRVVKTGLFEHLETRRHRYHIRLDSLAELPAFIDLLGTPRPRLSPGTRARLRAQMRGGAHIRVTDRFLIVALRRPR